MEQYLPILLEDNEAYNGFLDMCFPWRAISNEDYIEWYDELRLGRRSRLDFLKELFNRCRTKRKELECQVFLKGCSNNDAAYRKVLYEGDFPRKQLDYVERKSLQEEVLAKVKALTNNSILVLYGIIGCGKTTMINNLLQNRNLLIEYFNNRVFWISLNEPKNEDNVIKALWRLYSKAAVITNTPPLSHCPQELEDLKAELKEVFAKDQLRKSLLVLNDFDHCEFTVIKAFDFGCKLIITTRERNIVPKNLSGIDFIEVNCGFTVQESIELFKKNLETNDMSKVLPEARKIHTFCRGLPVLIAPVGAYIRECKEQALRDVRVWQRIYDKLKEGQDLNEYSSPRTANNAIKICVEKLPSNLKEKYLQLGIFPKDVNIPSSVLMRYWNLSSEIEVHEIMVQFLNKSMAGSFYHNGRGTYIYVIHFWYLSYLRTNDLKPYHRRFVEAFEKAVQVDDYSAVAQDDYTLQYIGYHMKEAGMIDKFSIYSNLKFLEAKIKAAGPNDLLEDFDKYQDYIKQHKRDLDFEETKIFVKKYGKDIYHMQTSDIYQFGLQMTVSTNLSSNNYPVTHTIQDACKRKISPSRLYLKWTPQNDVFKTTKTVKLPFTITSLRSLHNKERVIVGTDSGSVKIMQNTVCLMDLIGHTSAVIQIILCCCNNFFMTLSKDGTVRLWPLPHTVEESDPTSPRRKQTFWSEPNPERTTSMEFKMESAIASAAFCQDFNKYKLIVTGSDRGEVIVWNANSGDPIAKQVPCGYSAKSVVFLSNNKYIAVSKNDNIIIYELDGSALFYSVQHYFSPSLEVLNIFFDWKTEILYVICPNSISILKKSKIRYTKVQESLIEGNIAQACITEDFKMIFLSTKSNDLLMWDTTKEALLQKKEIQHEGNIFLLDAQINGGIVNLTVAVNDLLVMKYFSLPESDASKPSRKLVFDSLWQRTNHLSVFLSANNQLPIYTGQNQIGIKTLPSSRYQICRFFDSDTVICALSNCSVILYSIRNGSNNYTVIYECRSPIVEMKCVPSKAFRTLCVIQDESNELHVIINTDDHKNYKLESNFRLKEVFLIEKTTLILISSEGLILVMDNLSKPLPVSQDEKIEVAFATMSQSSKFLAVCGEVGRKSRIILYSGVNSKNWAKATREIINLEEACTSCSISHNDELLAVGMKSGTINIYWIESGEPVIKNTLKFHEGPVKSLLFSPFSKPILVSLGEYIAWWNLQELLRTYDDFFDNSVFKGKQPYPNQKFLLAVLKLTDDAISVTASDDFSKFGVINNNEQSFVECMEVYKTSETE